MILGAKSRQDGSWSTADPEGTGGAGSNEIIFQTDFNAASAVLNGFDSWNIVESYLESGLTTTITHDGSRAIFNLKGGSTLNDVYMGKAFGNHHTVGDAAVGELYLRFIWQASNLAAINHFNGGVHKIALIDFRDPTTGIRAFQLVLGTISDGTNMRFFVDQTVFNRTTGQWVSSLPATAESTTTISVDTDYYLKLRVLNSSAGATDGAVQLWINNVLECEDNAIALNDANNDSPNMIIFGSYNSSRGATQDGVMQYEDCTLSNYDLGAWVASTLPTWRGYDDGSGAHNGSITADDVVLDMRDDLTVVAPNLVRVDQGTIVYNPTGGFDGNGCNTFTPNYNPGAGVEQHCGLGQIQGLLARPDNTKFVLGWRFRFGTGFKQIILRQGSYKHTIAETDPNDIQHVRQMLATQQGTITNILGPANGTIFNSTPDPGGNPLLYNENNGVPDCDVLGDVWCWANWIVDVNYNDPTYGMVGLNELRVWSADGTYDGTQVVRQFMTNGGGNGETYGAPLVRFDNLFCWVPVLSETTPADPGYDLDYARLIMGRNTPLSPTPGFLGHNASDWA